MSRKILSPSDARTPRQWKYSTLRVGDVDEVPLINDETEREDDEAGEDEENLLGRRPSWYQLGGNRRWRQRMKSHSTLLGLLCGGGWLVVWNK